MNKLIGIDLGTTNTVGAIAGRVLATADGSPTLPSVVAFPPNGMTLVGHAAKHRRAIDPRNTVSSAKRLMGKTWHSYNATRFRAQYPLEIVQTEQDGCAFKTRAGTFTPSQIASYVIGKLLVSHGLSAVTLDARVAVPTSFDDAAKQATLVAARQVGLRNVDTIAEPIATATAYLTAAARRERRVAVYDFGGGTFDLAVLDASVRPVRLIGHSGDAYLGGDDIDQALADWVCSRVLEKHSWDLKTNAEVYDRLLVQCERAKMRLQIAQQTRIELSQVDPGSPAGHDCVLLDMLTLQRIATPFITRTFLVCDEVLRAAGVGAASIDAVYLAGGTTLLPAVREAVSRYFSSPPRAELDPMEVVAIGASAGSVG